MNEREAAWPLSLRLLHWVSAGLMVPALGLGVYTVQWVHDPAARFELTQTHKGIGITILALTVVRLCRRGFVRAPEAAAAPWLRLAANAAHAALYLLLLAMPLSGWLMATTTPERVPTIVLGLFALPYPLAPDLGLYRFARTAHVALAVAFAALILLHIVAAFGHALIWRDQTLRRMWRPSRAVGDAGEAYAAMSGAD